MSESSTYRPVGDPGHLQHADGSPRPLSPMDRRADRPDDPRAGLVPVLRGWYVDGRHLVANSLQAHRGPRGGDPNRILPGIESDTEGASWRGIEMSQVDVV